MPYSPTPQDVAAMLPHVRYEIVQALSVPRHDPLDEHISESIFLAMLVHTRLLLDFFEHSRREKDDTLCSDFGFTPRKVPLAEEDRLRLNKDISHLTYSRLRHTAESKPWPIVEILQPLRERAASFVAHVVASPPAGSDSEELDRWKLLNEAFRKRS